MPTGGRCTDEHVAHHPAPEGGRPGQDEHPEQVEPLLDGHQPTGQREGEHPDEVEGQLEVCVEGEHREVKTTVAAWSLSPRPRGWQSQQHGARSTSEGDTETMPILETMAMRDLRLIGVQEDGQHLLLSDSDGERFRVQLDEPLRAAARRDRPRLGQLQIEIDGGHAAARGAGPDPRWALRRGGRRAVRLAGREGPPLRRARSSPSASTSPAWPAPSGCVAARAGGASAPTLSARVSQRLSGRGVDPASAEWDSARGTEGDWTVILTFPAGGRERQARWSFDVPARTVAAADDEARWLSEEDAVRHELAPAGPAPRLRPGARDHRLRRRGRGRGRLQGSRAVRHARPAPRPTSRST